MSTELRHYGIKGMRWGVRRYQNKDGSLTAEGRKHISNYRKSKQLDDTLEAQSNILVRSDKRLQKDFGSGSMVDDIDYLEMVAREYGLNTNHLHKAYVNAKTFSKENAKSIKVGRKLVEKYGYSIRDEKYSDLEAQNRAYKSRVNKAFKENPGLTYDKIYKEMKVDMSSEDSTPYKEAEAAWLKKHGY